MVMPAEIWLAGLIIPRSAVSCAERHESLGSYKRTCSLLDCTTTDVFDGPARQSFCALLQLVFIFGLEQLAVELGMTRLQQGTGK